MRGTHLAQDHAEERRRVHTLRAHAGAEHARGQLQAGLGKMECARPLLRTSMGRRGEQRAWALSVRYHFRWGQWERSWQQVQLTNMCRQQRPSNAVVCVWGEIGYLLRIEEELDDVVLGWAGRHQRHTAGSHALLDLVRRGSRRHDVENILDHGTAAGRGGDHAVQTESRRP